MAVLALLAFAATPALAAEDCAQALKDTTGKFKVSTIGPQATATAGDLITKAEPMCGGDAAQQAEAIELLRDARMMIGE
ncbi:MAG: hypothetical protein WCF13_06540 [Stellaceae bacterium]